MDQNKELKKAGLKVTLPRLKILQILQEPENQHISAEDVYKILIEQGEEIGLATVYRVLNQFDDAGILNRHHFEGGKSVFEHLDFTFKRGDRIGLMAPNGSGKTTLFHVIMGLLTPAAGTIEICPLNTGR